MDASGSSAAEGSRAGSDEFKQNIKKAYPILKTSLTKFEVTKITDKLYSHSIILTEECEYIQGFSTDTDRAQALCDIVLKKGDIAREIFLTALHEISRGELVALIWKKGSTPDEQRFFAQLEKRIKDHEDLVKRQREEYDLQVQELKNQEEKLQRQQVMQDEKEKSLKVLQEKLEKLKTELNIRERQQQANRMSIEKEQKDLLQLRQSLDEKEKGVKQLQENLDKQQKELQEKEVACQFMTETISRVPARHVLPVECRDVAVTADGHLLLAAMAHGMLEWDESGRQLSSWTPAKRARGGKDEDKVRTVDELQEGRVAVGLCYYIVGCYSFTVRLLGRSAAARDTWQEQQVFQLQNEPLLLSVHAQLVAVAEECRQLELLSLTDGQRELLRHDYCISSVAATADAVITASDEQVQLSDGRKQHVVDSYSHSGQLLWRQSFSKQVYDLHWSQVFSVVYLALRDSDRVTAIRAVDGQLLSEVVNSSHGLKKPWRLSLSRGPRTVLAVLHSDCKTVRVYPALGSGGSK